MIIVTTTSAYTTLSASGSSANIDTDNIACNATTDLIIEVGVNLYGNYSLIGIILGILLHRICAYCWIADVERLCC